MNKMSTNVRQTVIAHALQALSSSQVELVGWPSNHRVPPAVESCQKLCKTLVTSDKFVHKFSFWKLVQKNDANKETEFIQVNIHNIHKNKIP